MLDAQGDAGGAAGHHVAGQQKELYGERIKKIAQQDDAKGRKRLGARAGRGNAVCHKNTSCHLKRAKRKTTSVSEDFP